MFKHTPPPLEPMTNWQPIETAPRDGTAIIGWNGTYVSAMIWSKHEDDDGHVGWCRAGYEYGGILYLLHYAFDPEPTHWMPIPAPPKEPTP